MIAILLGCSVAQITHPDFSGTWKLTPAFEKRSAGHSSRYKINHRGEKLEVVHLVDGSPETSYFVLDGKKRVARITPAEMQARAYWEGDSIIIEKEEKIRTYTVQSVSKYTLSPDGKLLTIRTHSFASGFFPDVLEERVYEKQ